MQRMKLFAWFLGIVAAIATLVISANYLWARKHARLAASEVATYQDLSQSIQFRESVKEATDQTQYENDQMDVEIAHRQLELAELQGKNTSAARFQVTKAEAIVSSDELRRTLSRHISEFGPSYDLQSALGRVAASQESAAVYGRSLERDEHLGYGIGVLWLAFGFAFALSGRKA